MSVYLQDPDVTLYHGDVLEQLAGLPDESVHCVVTSPPYWGLRSYLDDGHADKPSELGLEPTPDLYIERMVLVFREVRRVLRKDGTCWLNMGDSYDHGTNKARGSAELKSTVANRNAHGVWADGAGGHSRHVSAGLKQKNLIGMPWRLAFALQADGWWLRADIIWSKPNPMPESVTDRPTKAHEYVLLLTRSPRYFFDQEAVREPNNPASIAHHDRFGANHAAGKHQQQAVRNDGDRHNGWVGYHPAGRNVRSVWTIATQAFSEAHFATFPTELARRCILAGTSERGCCPECGAPWVREVASVPLKNSDGSCGCGTTHGRERVHRDRMRDDHSDTTERHYCKETHTLKWRASCDCSGLGQASGNESVKTSTKRRGTGQRLADERGCRGAEAGFGRSDLTIPCMVLDPFVGSGTVPYVARLHGRHAIGIDLNADYLNLAARRLQQQSLFASSSTEGAV